MKTSKYLLLLLASATLAVSSCVSDNDFLDEKSWNFDDQGFYSSESEIEMGLNACYAQVNYLTQGQPQGLHSYQIFGIGLDTFSPTGGTNKFATMSAWGPSDDNNRHWNNELFFLVNYANTVIDVVDERGDKITYSSSTKKEEIIAEGRFFRGFAYRVLAAMYGNVPIIEHRTSEVITGYEPNTRQEVWEFVYEDFKYAAAHLPVKASKPGKITRAAADHYLAEVCLALGKFAEAEQAATRVISKQDGNYALMTSRFGSRANETTDRYGNSLAAPAGAYWDLFRPGGNQNDPANTEAIWVGQFNHETWAKGGGGAAWWRIRGWNVFDKGVLSNAVLGWNGSRTTKETTGFAKAGTKFYVMPEAALLPLGIDNTNSGATSASDDETGLYKGRFVGSNFQRDSIGGNVAYVGRYVIPSRYVWKGLWNYRGNENGQDFRGSETMIQRDPFLPSGKRLSEVMAEYYKRAEMYPDEPMVQPQGGDTLAFYPRFWKWSDDKYPKGRNEVYDVDLYYIRLAETYLLRAEAYLAQGNAAKAADDINVLRDRANAPHCTAADVNIDYILDERTRELFLEEHRIVTLNRLSVNPNCGAYVTSVYPVQNETQSNTLYERVRKYAIGYEDTAACDAWEQRDGWVKGGEMEAMGLSRNVSPIKPWNFQYAIHRDVILSNTGKEYPQNPGY